MAGTTFLPTTGGGDVPQWHGTYPALVVAVGGPTGTTTDATTPSTTTSTATTATASTDTASATLIQMYVPQVLGTAVSNWAPPLNPFGTAVPAVGTQIYAVFRGGDPAYPAYVNPVTAAQLADATSGGDGTSTSVAVTTTTDGNGQLLASSVTTDDSVAAVATDDDDSTSLDYSYTDSGGTDYGYASVGAGGFNVSAGSTNAADPTTGTPTTPAQPETWHPVSYQNSWAAFASGTDLQYKLAPDHCVHLSGRLTCPGSLANPSTICTLPSHYWPTRAEPFYCLVHPNSTPYTATTCIIIINTNGTIQLYGAPTSGYTTEIQGRYPLDG